MLAQCIQKTTYSASVCDQGKQKRIIMPNRNNIRLIWELVTATPCASIRTLHRRSGLAFSTVRVSLARLRELGYIEYEDGKHCARKIIIPFAVIRPGRMIKMQPDESEEMTCNDCGETWTNTGDPICPHCGSSYIEPVDDDENDS
mgnify:FL=1